MQDWKSLWRHGRRHPIETVISLLVIALIAWAIWASGSWVVQAADWSVVGSNLPLYLSGSYPASERWRPWLLGFSADGAHPGHIVPTQQRRQAPLA